MLLTTAKRLAVLYSVTGLCQFHFVSAKCEDSEPALSPCDKYNTALQRLQWAQRRERCNSNSSCVFVGRSMLGTCTLKDKEAKTKAADATDASVRDETSPLALVAELIPAGDGPPLQVLLTGSLAKTAADSLKSSRETTLQLAKTLVIDVFDEPENINKAGELLSNLFTYESIRSPTRWLIYYSLSHPYNAEEIFKLVKYQRDSWMVGNQYTVDQLVQLLEWQLRDETTRKTVFLPLLKWSLVGPDNDDTYKSLVRVVNESIPTWREPTTFALVETVHSVLDSQDVKDMAKGVVLEMLKERLEEQEAIQQSLEQANEPDVPAPENPQAAALEGQQPRRNTNASNTKE